LPRFSLLPYTTLFRSACRSVGFFTVCGHGIDKTVVEDAHVALKQFFHRPLAEKINCRLETGFTRAVDDYTPYGYSGLLEENAFRSEEHMSELQSPYEL